MKKSEKTNNCLIGNSGVHWVVSELSLRELIALPTMRNTAGIDIVVTNQRGSWHANLQVKTSKKKVKFWPVGNRYKELKGKRNYYVFLRYLKDKSCFEAFLEVANKVVNQVDKENLKCRRQGYKKWSPCWYLPKDNKQQFCLAKQWTDFGKRK